MSKVLPLSRLAEARPAVMNPLKTKKTHTHITTNIFAGLSLDFLGICLYVFSPPYAMPTKKHTSKHFATLPPGQSPKCVYVYVLFFSLKKRVVVTNACALTCRFLCLSPPHPPTLPTPFPLVSFPQENPHHPPEPDPKPLPHKGTKPLALKLSLHWRKTGFTLPKGPSRTKTTTRVNSVRGLHSLRR